MKKFLSLIVMLVVTFAANICAAYVYDNNPDYIYIGTYGSGGYSTYLYLPSIDVQEYNPPHYQIAGNFVTIGGKKTIEEAWGIEFVRYNWYTKETYSKNYQGLIVKENVSEGYGYRSYYINRANALFRAAYGMDFYDY